MSPVKTTGRPATARPRPNARRIAIASFVAAAAAAPMAPALEWYAEPVIRLGAEYQNNPLLTTEARDSARGLWAAPVVDVGGRSAIWDIRASAGARAARYDIDSFDSDSDHVSINTHRRTERSTWRLNAARHHESILTSEEIDPDTGLPEGRRQRQTDTVAPGLGIALDALTRLDLGYQRSRVSYEDGAPIGLVDYRQDAATASLSRQWSARTLFSLSGSGSRFDVPARDFESRTVSVTVGASHQFSQALRFGLSAGARRTTSDGNACVETVDVITGNPPRRVTVCQRLGRVADVDRGAVYTLDMERRFARSRLNASASRAINPSGSGTEVESDTASFTFEHDLRPSRLWVSLATSATRHRAVTGDPAGIDRDYYRIEPRIRYRLTRDIDVEGGYRYVRQQFEGGRPAAANDVVFATFVYRLPRWSASR